MRSRNEKKIGMTSTDIKLDLICFFFWYSARSRVFLFEIVFGELFII